MPDVLTKCVPAGQTILPRQPETYELTTRLILTIREPFRSQVCQVRPGQSLRLERDRTGYQGGLGVRVVTADGQPVGFLCAEVASYLAILLDHDAGIVDRSYAEAVLLAAPPDDPAARRLRYPKLFIHLVLDLPHAWPLFAIAAVLGLKTEDYACRFNLAGNPWLMPIARYHAEYQQLGHDHFRLPQELAEAWMVLTSGTCIMDDQTR
jgi:hypothetical protein